MPPPLLGYSQSVIYGITLDLVDKLLYLTLSSQGFGIYNLSDSRSPAFTTGTTINKVDLPRKRFRYNRKSLFPEVLLEQ